MGERVRHVNRIKGLLSAQGVFGYEPLRKGRLERLEDLRTGDGRPLPVRLKAQIIRELDRLEVLLEQLKTVEAERDALLKPASGEAASPAAMLARLKGIGSETAASCGRRACSASSTTGGRWPPTPAWHRRHGRAARSITSRVCPRRATRG